MTLPRLARFSGLACLPLALLAACASGPKPPDWSINAVGHMERATQAYLSGDTRVQAREYALARTEVARTARPELLARVELARCAAQVASLQLDDCPAFAPLRQDATDTERAYADYLHGQQLPAARAALLPAAHRAVAAGGTALPAADEPLARLIAAGVLLRRSQLTPDHVSQAVDTASGQGWRRPLLAWLGVQARLADERGDAEAAARARRRMDLVQPLSPASAPATTPAPASAPGAPPAPGAAPPAAQP